MWLRALTILFELRARVSQNLKTTIDINHHLFDNRLQMSQDEYDSISYKGNSETKKFENELQRRSNNKGPQKTKTISSKFQRRSQQNQGLNESREDIDEESMASIDVDNVSVEHSNVKLQSQPRKIKKNKKETIEHDKTISTSQEAGSVDYDKDLSDIDIDSNVGKNMNKNNSKRINRFQKSRNADNFVKTEVQKPKTGNVESSTAVRSKSQLMEAKKAEIARRIEANKRLMVKTKELSEFQKQLDQTLSK